MAYPLKLTVAEFRATRDLRVANFTRQSQFERSDATRETAAAFTWRELVAWMFASPFDPRDDTAYVPTQYIAERIKAAGFDGIAYDSALHAGGYNVALFDTTAAVASSRKLADVKEIIVRVEFGDVGPDAR
jgi:hypothetical protein